MENQNIRPIDPDIDGMRENFNAKVSESYWSENGELVYVLENGTDLEKYSQMIKMIFSDTGEPEMDFIIKVMHADGGHSVCVECNFALDTSSLADDDEAVTEYDTLEYFKEFWNDDVKKKFNSEREVDFEVSEGVDLMKASRLIFTYINESTTLGKDITVVLKNISGHQERLLVPSNV